MKTILHLLYLSLCLICLAPFYYSLRPAGLAFAAAPSYYSLRPAGLAFAAAHVLRASDINYETIRLERRLTAVKVTGKIAIDGKLDEPAWAAASRALEFIQKEPNEGEPASEKTEVRVLYDTDNLYFGVVAKDPEAAHIIISELKKDFTVDNGDSFQIVLDTFHDERNAYQFIINPAGAKWDAQIANEGREVNTSWDGVWYVKSSIVDDGWVAEIAIPFKTLKFPRAPVQTWGINFQRTIRRRNEESLWAPVPRIYSVQRVSLAGTLEGLEGIEPGSNIKIKPYIFSSFAQNGPAKTHKYDGDAGLDLKYGITSGLTLDLTYNTDFSQVEADEQQINLSRYSLLFPEKRDFFLENSGIFQFGVPNASFGGGAAAGTGTNVFASLNPRPNAVRNDLIQFFSRTIGISPATGDAIPILGGARLTGSAGKYQIGVLNIQQRSFGSTKPTNFFVGRVRRNILANSDIGLMMTNKDVNDSPLYNRSIGADANFRFGQAVTLNGFVTKTTTPGLSGKDLAARLALQYLDRDWQFSGTYTVIQENFHNEMGFVPRVGIRKFASVASYTWRPEKWRSLIRNVRPHWQVDYVLDASGRIQTRYNDIHLPFQFQNGASVEMGKNPTLEYFSQPFTISGITVTPREYRFNDYFILGNTDMSRRLSANGRWSAGKFYSGYKHSYQGGGAFRANYKLTTSFLYTYNNIELNEGRVKQKLLAARVNYGFTTTMFLNAFIQYNSDTKQWSSNVRFNIIHRPLSDIFVVYNERRDSLTGGLIDRAVIAKMTYMISR
jgi:uncharacterized protein DUF5916/cellulose/xylan binding protein with CBM9 domain